VRVRFIIWLWAASALAQTGIDAGNSVWGPGGNGISWHGFVAGSPTSTYRQNAGAAATDPNNTTWMGQTTGGQSWTSQQLFWANQVDGFESSDSFSEAWLGQPIVYVHGDTAPRRVVKAIEGGTPDPGTVPVPNNPLIAGTYGSAQAGNVVPRSNLVSRPWGPLLNIYAGAPAADFRWNLVDVDNGFVYEGWNCQDGTTMGQVEFSCANNGVYWLGGGGFQRPFNEAGKSNVSSVSGMPELFGTLHADEYYNALNNSVPIKHALVITASNCCHVGWATGEATYGQYISTYSSAKPPLGAKLVLNSSVTLASTGAPASCGPMFDQLHTYGLIFIDGGATGTLASQQIEAPQSQLPQDCWLYFLTNFPGWINASNFHFVQQTNTSIVCVNSTTGCPNSPPSGTPASVTSFLINNASSASISLSAGGTANLTWTVSNVIDGDGNPLPQRNVSWGPNNRLGPGWINAFRKGEAMQITACAGVNPTTHRACDFQAAGNYPIQLGVWNRFNTSLATATVTLTVTP
jgi:hypothetical protein